MFRKASNSIFSLIDILKTALQTTRASIQLNSSAISNQVCHLLSLEKLDFTEHVFLNTGYSVNISGWIIQANIKCFALMNH